MFLYLLLLSSVDPYRMLTPRKETSGSLGFLFWLVMSGLGAVIDGTGGALANSSGFHASLETSSCLGWLGRRPPHVMLQPAHQAPMAQPVHQAPMPQRDHQAPTPLVARQASMP